MKSIVERVDLLVGNRLIESFFICALHSMRSTPLHRVVVGSKVHELKSSFYETERDIWKGKALSFKVNLYLNDYCEAYEIQRFFVPQDLHYLKEKIKSLFGKKVQHGFKIFWMDNDGDEVRIKVNFS